MWKSFVRVGIAFGKFVGVTVLEFMQAPSRWMKASYIAKGFEYHDPLKEGTAALVTISGCLSTLERECSLRNMDWRENIEQRGREIKAMQDAGVPIVMIGGAQVVSGQGDGTPAIEEAEPAKPGDRPTAQATVMQIPLADVNRLIELTEETIARNGNGHHAR
jgi:capsid protein